MRRVFVVDDHIAIREGYRAILERSGRFEVAGEAGSAEDALSQLAQASVIPVPDLFIVDVSLPGKSGLELCRELKRLLPESAVVVVSMHRRYEYLLGAFRSGASCYVSKDAGSEPLVAALEEASRGGAYIDSASLKLFITEAIRPQGGSGRTSPLSDREREILGLFGQGLRAEDIAIRLDLSQKTVENHLSNITSKLGARDRFELYRMAASEAEGS